MDCRDVNYSYSPAFQAKLKVNDLNLNAKKLKQVCEIVENKSQQYSDDVLDLSEMIVRRDDGSVFSSTNFSLNGQDVGVAVTKDFMEFFDNNSAIDVSKALLRVFKKGKANEVFQNRIHCIKENIKSAISGELLSADKYKAAIKRKDFLQAQIQEILSLSFKNRVKSLEGQRKNIENLHEEISDKITNTPISSIMYWD